MNAWICVCIHACRITALFGLDPLKIFSEACAKKDKCYIAIFFFWPNHSEWEFGS